MTKIPESLGAIYIYIVRFNKSLCERREKLCILSERKIRLKCVAFFT